MYCKGQVGGKNADLRFRMTEKHHLFRNPGSGHRVSRLALTTDTKPRLKWTADLHRQFVEAVNQLGGPAVATPGQVLRAMSIPGLTLYHLKSHLQKYRLSRNVHGKAHGRLDRTVTAGQERAADANGPYIGIHENRRLSVTEAWQIQFETQRRCQAQLEVQQQLQLQIEAQWRYLKSVLEKAQETLGRHNLDTVVLEAARFQLSELINIVSDHELRSKFSGKVELQACQPKERWLVMDERCQSNRDLLKGKNASFHRAGGNFLLTGWTDRKKTAGMPFLAASATPRQRNSLNPTEAKRGQLLPGLGPHFPDEKLDLNICSSEEDHLESKELDLNEFSWS